MKENIKRFLPLACLLIVMVIAYVSGLTHYLNMETLKSEHTKLLSFVYDHPVLSPVLFTVVYILCTALALPVGFFLCLLSGYLFPQPWSTLYVITGSAIGGSIIFLATKTALGDFLLRKSHPSFKKMEEGFQKHSVSYLLSLRLIHVFPSWIVDAGAAFMGVKLWTFFWTAFIGLIPLTLVFTQEGAALQAIIATGAKFSIETILTLKVRIALIILGALALMPVLIRTFKDKRNDR